MLGGIEAGGTKIVLAVARDPGAILARAEIPTVGPGETCEAICAFFSRHAPLAALGVASFGPLDVNPASPRHGRILETPKPGWAGVDLLNELGAFACPVVVDTDVSGGALAEWRAATGQGVANLAYATIGTGIGVGVVRGGETRKRCIIRKWVTSGPRATRRAIRLKEPVRFTAPVLKGSPADPRS